MNFEEIKSIEENLAVLLPSHYVDFVRDFGGLKNDEFEIENFLYSSANSVIEVNKTLGFYGNDKIIKQKLIIGDNGGGDFYLINLENPADKKIYVFDHEEFTGDFEVLEYYDTIDEYINNLVEIFGPIKKS